MASKKYISTKETVRLTGLSTEEIYNLIHSGTLPAHKAPKSGWRISPQDLVDLGLIHEETETVDEVSQTEEGFSYIADEEHYTEVFRRMTEVKQSLKIATGDLKRSSLLACYHRDARTSTSPLRKMAVRKRFACATSS